MEEKHCKFCNKVLDSSQVGNDYTCNDCEQKRLKKQQKQATLVLIAGIVLFILFIEMVLLTIFKSVFGGFDVAFLVIGIILSILFFIFGGTMITVGAMVLQQSKIMRIISKRR